MYFFFTSALTKDLLEVYFTSYDLKRLEMYSNNMADYHLIMDLLPSLARMYFENSMGDVHLSPVQAVSWKIIQKLPRLIFKSNYCIFWQAILLGVGLEHKTVDKLAEELGLPSSQLLGLFNKIIRKGMQHLNSIAERHIEESLNIQTDVSNVKVNEKNGKSLHDELESAAKVFIFVSMKYSFE